MNYKKCCRNCEHAYLENCKSCSTFGDNAYKNFELRKELATLNNNIEQRKKTCVYDDEQESIRFEKAETVAEQALCEVKCLCPSIKEAGICCQCEVFASLRDYYFEEMENSKL